MKFIYYNLLFILVLLTSYVKTQQLNDTIPQHDTFKIQSKHVAEERIINVWTPENYKTNIDSLHVMYIADGGTKEDFPHIANTLAKLIKENKTFNFSRNRKYRTQKRFNRLYRSSKRQRNCIRCWWFRKLQGIY